MSMEQISLHTRIVTKVMEVAYKLDKVDCDKERICYLVTDEEWDQLVRYAGQFSFQDCSVPGSSLSTMRFAGIEIIKRSADSAGGIE
jgi:hypothetical protein